MRMSRSALVWGLTLIVLGAVLLAQQQGWLRASVPFWAWVFGGLGVLFLLTALFNRSAWGTVFPGFILLGLGVVIFLAESQAVSGNLIGAAFLASAALPFWTVALLRRGQWWAVIPAGVITVLAAMPLLAESRLSGQWLGAIFFLGLAATFGLARLWSMGRPGTGWTWYPALGLGLVGLIVLASGDPQVWPVVLIGLGLVLLIRSLRPRRAPGSGQPRG